MRQQQHEEGKTGQVYEIYSKEKEGEPLAHARCFILGGKQ